MLTSRTEWLCATLGEARRFTASNADTTSGVDLGQREKASLRAHADPGRGCKRLPPNGISGEIERKPAGLLSLPTAMNTLQTERLILRNWRPADRRAFARMNADPQVMEFMPGTLSEAESDLLLDKIEKHIETNGFGLFAAELRGSHPFIGYVGLAIPSFQAAFTPCVELGWRLSAMHWGKGLATEGAREVVRYAFGVLELAEVVSFTVPGNIRSRRVMEKLGMTHDIVDDFNHPKLPEGHVLQRHVLYRLKAAAASF